MAAVTLILGRGPFSRNHPNQEKQDFALSQKEKQDFDWSHKEKQDFDLSTQKKITEEKKEKDVVKMDVESETEPPPLGNGGSTDKYVWTQTLSEVEVSIDIDANLRGKHLKIEIAKNKLFVAIKGKESEPIIDGKLHDSVNVDDSSWTLDQSYGKEKKTLTVLLSKMKGMNWWSRVIVGDAEIDTSKIQPENSKLDSLDDDTRQTAEKIRQTAEKIQQTAEKMMFDQRQRMKGLPTSKEREQDFDLSHKDWAFDEDNPIETLGEKARAALGDPRTDFVRIVRLSNGLYSGQGYIVGNNGKFWHQAEKSWNPSVESNSKAEVIDHYRRWFQFIIYRGYDPKCTKEPKEACDEIIMLDVGKHKKKIRSKAQLKKKYKFIGAKAAN